MTSRIITHAGITFNLAEVKCFRLSTYNDIGKQNTIIIEFKTRYDFISNPNIGKFEKQEYNEVIEIQFPDYDTAKVHQRELEEIWQDYLDDQA
jgi:hypothetical protein